MSVSKRTLMFAFFYLIAIAAWAFDQPARARQAAEAVDGPSVGPVEAEPGLFDPPPGDPWSSPPQQARGPQSSAGDALVRKARIAPHWFGQNTRFWYRNDLVQAAANSFWSTP